MTPLTRGKSGRKEGGEERSAPLLITGWPEQPCVVALRELRPDVAIMVVRSIDWRCEWGGDGPNPREEGFEPYVVTVTATAIKDGVLVQGGDFLGSCWYRPTEAIGEIHGYLPQMVEQAVSELDACLAAQSGTGCPMANLTIISAHDTANAAEVRFWPGTGLSMDRAAAYATREEASCVWNGASPAFPGWEAVLVDIHADAEVSTNGR